MILFLSRPSHPIVIVCMLCVCLCLVQLWLSNGQFPLLPVCWQAVFYLPTAFPTVSLTFQFVTPSVVVNQHLVF